MADRGTVLDKKYKLVHKLGEGGMGTVYEARNIAIGKRVAVKILLPCLAQNKDLVKRFHNEARAAAAVGHPGIINVCDLGQAEDGSPYLVMEYLDGQNLESLLEIQGKLDLAFTAYMACQILSGLSAVHNKGVVHRDLKPDNIFLVDVGRSLPEIKLIDFGISKFTDPAVANAKLTETGTFLGTPHYMSPEHARGSKDLDQRTDIYSLGTILFRCMTGQMPFEGDNYNQILTKIVSERAPRPSDVLPSISPAFEAVILRAMSPDREQRFESADAFLSELLPFVDERAKDQLLLPAPLRHQEMPELHSAVLEELPQDLTDDAELADEELTDGVQGAPTPNATGFTGFDFVRPRRWPWALGATLLIATAGALFGWIWENNRADEPDPVERAVHHEDALRLATLVSTTPLSTPEQEEVAPSPLDAGAPVDSSGDVGPTPQVAEPASPPRPEKVTITVVPNSRMAQVLIDGKRLRGPPYVGVFSRNDRRRTITVLAAGYRPWRQKIAFDDDLVVTAELVRRQKMGARPSAPSKNPPRRPPESEDPWGD